MSHPSTRWWGRYQPVDFRKIEGPLGDAEDLAKLCKKAGQLGLEIFADAVLNHMTNHQAFVKMGHDEVIETSFERFKPEHFHRFQNRPKVARGARLPELRTDLPWVRSELKDYLHWLYQLGIRGFRFDAAIHLDASFLPWVLSTLPPVTAFAECVATDPRQMPKHLLSCMQAYDFPLAHTMHQAFRIGGDLRILLDASKNHRALWGPKSIPFVNNHDLARRRSDFRQFRIDDKRDRELAHVFLLGRLDGTPIIYRPDLASKTVKAAMKFRAVTQGSFESCFLAQPTLLAWVRGNHGLVILNTSGESYYEESFSTPLAPGVYRDLLGKNYFVDRQGTLGELEVKPRSALLIVPYGA